MNPKVDIIIPVYGSAGHLSRCVEALNLTVTPEQAQIWICDDATPPGAELEGIAGIFAGLSKHYRAERSKKNRGYAATNNYMAAKGKAEYICLLNSDTQPQAGWLDALVNVMDMNENIAIAGAKLVFPLWIKNDPARPAGRIQHAGVAFNADRMPYHIFAGWQPTHPKVNRQLLMKAVTGACMLVRRSVYETLGGLDPIFKQGNFEDIDFCLRVGEAGMDIAYVPEAALWHFGSGSNNTAAIEQNALIFRSRWRDKIAPDDHLYW